MVGYRQVSKTAADSHQKSIAKSKCISMAVPASNLRPSDTISSHSSKYTQLQTNQYQHQTTNMASRASSRTLRHLSSRPDGRPTTGDLHLPGSPALPRAPRTQSAALQQLLQRAAPPAGQDRVTTPTDDDEIASDAASAGSSPRASRTTTPLPSLPREPRHATDPETGLPSMASLRRAMNDLGLGPPPASRTARADPRIAQSQRAYRFTTPPPPKPASQQHKPSLPMNLFDLPTFEHRMKPKPMTKKMMKKEKKNLDLMAGMIEEAGEFCEREAQLERARDELLRRAAGESLESEDGESEHSPVEHWTTQLGNRGILAELSRNVRSA